MGQAGSREAGSRGGCLKKRGGGLETLYKLWVMFNYRVFVKESNTKKLSLNLNNFIMAMLYSCVIMVYFAYYYDMNIILYGLY